VQFNPDSIFTPSPDSKSKQNTPPPQVTPPKNKRERTSNSGQKDKSKKQKDSHHDDVAARTLVPFAENNGDTVRIYKTVYSVQQAALKTNKQQGDMCWEVALSHKPDAEAHANCTKQGCNDPPGQGRHERIFAKHSIDPKTCIHKQQTKEFQLRFNKERLRFGPNPFGRG
jgi:hypothetical protein